MTNPIATIDTDGEQLCLSLDEVKARLATGQLSQDALIDCPAVTGDSPKPIWMVAALRGYADTPEARMMDHLRAGPTAYVATALFVGMVLMWVLQGRGWISAANVGLGWSSLAIQNHWWAPWLHWGVHLDLAHWIGNAGLLYFCARRVERIIGSVSLIWALSWILWGVSLAVWQWETHLVIGASSWVFGLWAMQVGLGFRLADSLPPSVQAHYGWGNFLVFVPMLVLNTLSVNISNIAHWVAMLIGAGCSVWLTPQTSRLPDSTRLRWSMGLNLFGHGLCMLGALYLTTLDRFEGTEQRLLNGLTIQTAPNLLEASWCELRSWQQDGVVLYAGDTRYAGNIKDVDRLRNELQDCVDASLVCTAQPAQMVTWQAEPLSTHDWQIFRCSGKTRETVLEWRLKRGDYTIRIGCQVFNDFALDWCQEWLQTVVVEETMVERQATKHWQQHDQRGGKALEYAQVLQLYGRWSEVDQLYTDMEDRFDDFRWRATEERLRLHRSQRLDWPHERLWLESVVKSLPVDEIEVLRQLVLLANERGWCEISLMGWRRWRSMMPTGLDDIGLLVEECAPTP